MSIWRVGRTGRNTLLIPSEVMKGWTALLQALQREPQMQATDSKTLTQEAYIGQKAAQANANPMQKAPKAQPQNEEVPAKWQLAMVVIRSAPIHPWSMIEYMLGAGLQRGVTLHLFGVDKALLYCISKQEKEKLVSQGKNMPRRPPHQSLENAYIPVNRLPFRGFGRGCIDNEKENLRAGRLDLSSRRYKLLLFRANRGGRGRLRKAKGGIADKEDDLEPVIPAAASAATRDTTANEQGVRTVLNSNRGGGHQIAIVIRDVQPVSISRNSNTHQDQGKGKEILIHPAQPKTSSIMGTTRFLKGLVLDGPTMWLGSPSSLHETWTPTIKTNKTDPSLTNREVLQTSPPIVDMGLDSSQEGQTPTLAILTEILHVQDRARDDIIQDSQRGRLALSQGQIQIGDTPHLVRASKSLVIRQDDSSPAVNESSVYNGSKSDDSTLDGESSPNEYVQDSLDFGEHEDLELDFDQYE
ncbi:hypothetical protein Syun_017696 [Stephania yunnanensis]|uniref:Uncharacterized protein n=1 Tax=Stephania yunnanensis TaxID=152371 RepID=A0AAP0J7K4_9MAGN